MIRIIIRNDRSCALNNTIITVNDFDVLKSNTVNNTCPSALRITCTITIVNTVISTNNNMYNDTRYVALTINKLHPF